MATAELYSQAPSLRNFRASQEPSIDNSARQSEPLDQLRAHTPTITGLTKEDWQLLDMAIKNAADARGPLVSSSLSAIFI